MLSLARPVLIVIILCGIALRIWNAFHDPSLWLDEAFSAKLAESPLVDLLLAVPRFDTHPPLYYVQLHVWSLFGSGDSWLILNSVVIDILVILSLVHIVGRTADRMSGLWAGAVYAVLPLNVFFAENVRMYAMFFLLIVWLWYMLEIRLTQGKAPGRARIGTILLGLAATLTHGLGFFVVFFVYLQCLVRIYLNRGSNGLRPAVLLVVDYLPVALASLYSLGIGSFRQTEGLRDFDLEVIGLHLTISFFGMEVPRPTLAGYVGAILILVPPLFVPRSRIPMIGMVLVPFATLLVLTLVVKSVFMYRTMGLFSPFLAMSLGLFFAHGWEQRQMAIRVLSAVLVALFVVGAVNTSLAFQKEGFRGIAQVWMAEAPEDAVLFVDGSISLWGLTRYIETAPAYSALDVQPPVRDGMLRLKERLEGTAFERAGLFGETDHLTIGNREIWPYVSEQRLASAGRYWVLSLSESHCLRPDDVLLQQFEATGHKLVECSAVSPQASSG